jgi:hypothetical protein
MMQLRAVACTSYADVCLATGKGKIVQRNHLGRGSTLAKPERRKNFEERVKDIKLSPYRLYYCC